MAKCFKFKKSHLLKMWHISVCICILWIESTATKHVMANWFAFTFSRLINLEVGWFIEGALLLCFRCSVLNKCSSPVSVQELLSILYFPAFSLFISTAVSSTALRFDYFELHTRRPLIFRSVLYLSSYWLARDYITSIVHCLCHKAHKHTDNSYVTRHDLRCHANACNSILNRLAFVSQPETE